ncbi:hypothetical protein SYNTR_2295 [Candidatus Syntrophocurvum alkaliphilum]|uniref:Cyclic lactone autoinducer peptide n=1 Tax=Candidatus Syntrophocurvum alkaliphilum TaxID=2293317 RepID=A0A6I6DK04_9FIRM|nr:cyclic lactone autoinducer peptide [Candidatus Syntrophocurvum alkaliphilum]QGU00889.1 hypothetical protein SYNTR_2295 [Candidatus Syntrophocurvum alkaliphilum]
MFNKIKTYIVTSFASILALVASFGANSPYSLLMIYEPEVPESLKKDR